MNTKLCRKGVIIMTNKELIKLAGNEDALYYLEEIRVQIINMPHKTEWERKTAKNKIRAAANVIRTILAEESIDEMR